MKTNQASHTTLHSFGFPAQSAHNEYGTPAVLVGSLNSGGTHSLASAILVAGSQYGISSYVQNGSLPVQLHISE